jgi:hypothetical protein
MGELHDVVPATIGQHGQDAMTLRNRSIGNYVRLELAYRQIKHRRFGVRWPRLLQAV